MADGGISCLECKILSPTPHEVIPEFYHTLYVGVGEGIIQSGRSSPTFSLFLCIFFEALANAKVKFPPMVHDNHEQPCGKQLNSK